MAPKKQARKEWSQQPNLWRQNILQTTKYHSGCDVLHTTKLSSMTYTMSKLCVQLHTREDLFEVVLELQIHTKNQMGLQKGFTL